MHAHTHARTPARTDHPARRRHGTYALSGCGVFGERSGDQCNTSLGIVTVSGSMAVSSEPTKARQAGKHALWQTKGQWSRCRGVISGGATHVAPTPGLADAERGSANLGCMCLPCCAPRLQWALDDQQDWDDGEGGREAWALAVASLIAACRGLRNDRRPTRPRPPRRAVCAVGAVSRRSGRQWAQARLYFGPLELWASTPALARQLGACMQAVTLLLARLDKPQCLHAG